MIDPGELYEGALILVNCQDEPPLMGVVYRTEINISGLDPAAWVKVPDGNQHFLVPHSLIEAVYPNPFRARSSS